MAERFFFKYQILYTGTRAQVRGSIWGALLGWARVDLGPGRRHPTVGRSFCGQDGPDGLHNSPMYVALAPKLNETGGGTGGADLRSLY